MPAGKKRAYVLKQDTGLFKCVRYFLPRGIKGLTAKQSNCIESEQTNDTNAKAFHEQ